MIKEFVSPEWGHLFLGSLYELPSDVANELIDRGYGRLEDSSFEQKPIPVEEEVEVLGGIPKGYPVLRSLNRQSRPSKTKRAGKHRTSGRN